MAVRALAVHLMKMSGSHSRYFNKAVLEIGCLAIASYMKTRCLSLYRENNNGEERLISDNCFSVRFVLCSFKAILKDTRPYK